jgi:urease accessory protein
MTQAALLALAFVLAPLDAASAAGGPRSFQAGLLHPVLVPAHAIALLGLGMLIGTQEASRRRLAIASYVAGLGAGCAAMIAAIAPTFSAEFLLAAAAANGTLVALGWPVHGVVGSVAGLLTGAALALDSSPGGILVREADAALAGTFCGAVILLLGATRLTTLLRRDWQRLGIRIFGSWIAASALLVLALTLTR